MIIFRKIAALIIKKDTATKAVSETLSSLEAQKQKGAYEASEQQQYEALAKTLHIVHTSLIPTILSQEKILVKTTLGY